MFKHIFLTGDTTLSTQLINDLHLEACGFKTKPYIIEDQEKGTYIESLIDTPSNYTPISIHLNNENIPLNDILNTVGTQILETCLSSHYPYIIMDQIDFNKYQTLLFLEMFNECLHSEKHIIGSIAQLKGEWYALILASQTSCVLDINHENYEQIQVNIKRIISTWK